MTPTLSVVVVSSGRPEALRRCVLGLSQLRTAGAEVVVVADLPGLRALADLPVAERVVVLEQAQPNISAARNAGIEAARGEVIAFIDDDAVPEPTWAEALCDAFATPTLAAATGPVLGRNGISLQWGSLAIDTEGQDHDLDPNGHVRDGFARKLHGTNMAFRRDVFAQLGGFDEAFGFYLDDTDLALRVAQAGLATAYLPGAVVHHGFAASTRRTADRVPLSLFDIGASSAVFLRKHAPEARHAEALLALEAAQTTRLLRMVRMRQLSDDKMRDLMETLRDGIAAGKTRASAVPQMELASGAVQPMCLDHPKPPVVLSGWLIQGPKLRAAAAAHVVAGTPVSLFLFEPTPRKHKLRFTDGGWWEQTGGLYGPAVRSEPRLSFNRFKTRLAQEIRRISATRGLPTGGD